MSIPVIFLLYVYGDVGVKDEGCLLKLAPSAVLRWWQSLRGGLYSLGRRTCRLVHYFLLDLLVTFRLLYSILVLLPSEVATINNYVMFGKSTKCKGTS